MTAPARADPAVARAGWSLVDAATGAMVVESLEVADTYWARLVGLQFRAALPAGAGLLLVPCASVHTCFVRSSLDLAMLGDDGAVLAVRTAVRPWRFVVAPRGTHAVLEATAGTLRVVPGQRLKTVPVAPPV